jgi:hypothetical protein
VETSILAFKRVTVQVDPTRRDVLLAVELGIVAGRRWKKSCNVPCWIGPRLLNSGLAVYVQKRRILLCLCHISSTVHHQVCSFLISSSINPSNHSWMREVSQCWLSTFHLTRLSVSNSIVHEPQCLEKVLWPVHDQDR